jgi:hypothetical protein
MEEPATESNADNGIVLDPNSLGHVQIEVIHVTIGPSFTPVEQAPQLQDGDITISEKAVKGSSVSHSVKLVACYLASDCFLTRSISDSRLKSL